MKYHKLDGFDSPEFNIWILVNQEGMTEADAKRKVLWTDLMQAIGKRKCNTIGHKIKDQSYGGPEDGICAGYCLRCGYSYHNILY